MRRLSLLLPLLVAGCGSPTASTPKPTLEFISSILIGIPTLPAAAVGTEGMIEVTGVIHTDGTGFSLSGAVTLTGQHTLTLEIEAQDNAPGEPIPSQNYYRARLRMLAPGDYDLSVIYDIHSPPPGLRQRVFHETVHVF
jgi:hypothetical protein